MMSSGYRLSGKGVVGCQMSVVGKVNGVNREGAENAAYIIGVEYVILGQLAAGFAVH
jgi:hypothetical protein